MQAHQGKSQGIQEVMTKNLMDIQGHPLAELFEGTTFPWQILLRLSEYITKKINQIPSSERNKGTPKGSVFIDENVIIGEGTILEHGVMIKGPTIVGKNCEIRQGAYIRGNVIIGDQSVIGHSTEVNNSVIFEKAEISHFNYVGSSVVARRAHMAAGAITSNLKLDSSPISIKVGQQKIQTKLVKFGAFLGQHCQIGCNAVLNPGSIIGKESIIYPCVSFRGYLPANMICKMEQSQTVVERR